MGFIDKFINGFLVLILGSMVLVVAGNVFCRFVLNFSLYWADELAQILLVWLTFMGAALALKDKAHYVLNFLTERLKGRAQRMFWIFQQVLILISIFILFYFSAIVVWKIRFWVMPATEISRAFVYISCPLGCLLMLYYAIKIILHDKGGKGIEDKVNDIKL